MDPAESGKLAARYNLVEIAEACREGSEVFKLDCWNPASVQPVEVVAARLLARPILQEYDAFTVELAVSLDRSTILATADGRYREEDCQR